MRVDEVYPWDPVAEASAVYGQRYAGHPALAGRRAAGRTYLVGGPVALLSARATSWLHPRHQWPLETRSQFARRGWRQVGAIHVCHPWQRVHEYLLRCALEASDGLLLHGAIGGHDGTATVPRAALADASRLLLENYFPGDRLLENPMPRRLFSPHPRAVLQHAILSQNYGCHSLFLPTALDDTAEASPEPSKRLLVQATGRGLAVRPVFLARAFHCEVCGGVATEKSCPHDAAHRLVIPESNLHRRLLEGEHLPTTVTRPDVARLLARSVSVKAAGQVPASNRHHLFPHVAEVSRELRESLAGHRACVLWMTGLSGSGKSTVAHRLERELLLAGHRVFVLDGDTLRHGLNRDLGFSEEARRENLRRAAEVAKVMMDAGLIVIASFISPFRAERQMVRDIVGREFQEIYIEASLEECERRDPKGLYRRARAGQIPQFTGISSPYEVPQNPDMRIDTASMSVEECAQMLLHALSNVGMLRHTQALPALIPKPPARPMAALPVQ